MSRFSKMLIALAAAGVAASAAGAGYGGIGRAATPAEVRAWDIDVRPDFAGLPKGRGTVERGTEIWEAKCAACHGTFGESNEVFTPIVGGTTADDIKTGRVKALATGSVPQRTTLMKVATVSTLFDYIQRAMPWNAPKSLSPDEVYSVLAYVLNLADIIPADYELNEQTIREVQQRMPNRDGMSTDHGLWPGASASTGGIGNGGKPDVVNVACMKDCKPAVVIASTLPDYAKGAHGNLAEQNRIVGPVRGQPTGEPQAEAVAPAAGGALALAKDKGCMACHGVDSRIVGPAYKDIAARYKGQADIGAKLVAKVRDGGQGVWGSVPMPPNAGLKDEEIVSLVDWILSGAQAQ